MSAATVRVTELGNARRAAVGWANVLENTPMPIRVLNFVLALPFAALVALAACSQAPAPSSAPAAPAVNPQITKALGLYRDLQQQKSWELAATVGEDIVSRFPASAAATEVRQTLPEAHAHAAALVKQRRLQHLWSYQSAKESGGDQSTASIYSNDSAAADRVRLILRRHSAWGQSAYLYDSGKGFECRGTCTLALRIDNQPAQRIKAYLPPTGEPALFISDDKAFIAKMEKAQEISIDVVGKARGARTLVFDVGGFDATKFLPLPKK